jgi:hypothetical protein
MTLPNTTYVSIDDARKGVEPLTFDDLINIDLENFKLGDIDFKNFKLFNTDVFALPESANEYVAQQLYSAVNFICHHEYDNCIDAECNLCLETRTAPGHTFGEWTVIKPATSTEAGEEQRVCTVCGAIETAELEKLIDGNDDTAGDGSDEEDEGDSDDGKISAGAVVGIVIGSVVALGGGGFAGYWFAVKKKKIK